MGVLGPGLGQAISAGAVCPFAAAAVCCILRVVRPLPAAPKIPELLQLPLATSMPVAAKSSMCLCHGRGLQQTPF